MEPGIYTLSNGQVTLFSRLGGGPISINNKGAIAFQASITPGGVTGIFTGPDPVANKVIQTGDPLFGSIVTEVAFFREGLNDNGEVAFWARLQDGRQVIVRACPVKVKKDKTSA